MKILMNTLLLIVMAGALPAQDLIILLNGDMIEAKVLEIELQEIKYKRFNHQEGPTIAVAKHDVFVIKYENGLKEVITTMEEAPQTASPLSRQTVKKDRSFSKPKNKPLTPAAADRTLGENQYLLFGGLGFTGGDFSEFNTGYHLGLENTRFLSNHFGLTGQVSVAHYGVNAYVPEYGITVNGGMLNVFSMIGIRGETNNEIWNAYGLFLIGSDWAIPTGDFSAAFSDAFHLAAGGGLGLAYRDQFDFGLRLNYAFSASLPSVQIGVGYRF